MTTKPADYDALDKELRDLRKRFIFQGSSEFAVDLADAIRDLRAERDALIGLLREVRAAYMKDTKPFKLFGKAWNLRGCVDAALAAQEKVST